MKYAFIQGHIGQFRISSMCRVLVASRSSYYRWLRRDLQPTNRKRQRKLLDQLVADAFTSCKRRSGSPMLALDLKEQGHHYDRKTVAASMKRQHLRAKAAKKFKATTNSKHNLLVALNLLQQDFNTAAPNQKWGGDITCLWTEEGWLYLALVIGLYSRLVVGWAITRRMTADLPC